MIRTKIRLTILLVGHEFPDFSEYFEQKVVATDPIPRNGYF